MQVQKLSLEGLKLLKPKQHPDQRGTFFESYRESLFCSFGIQSQFVQENVSFSCYKTLRGLHFQNLPGQDKLVSCFMGKIWDVAVDLRPESPTFLQSEGLILSEENCYQLFIPKGFAHGFCVVSPKARVHYKVSAYYSPEEERSIRWNDPDIGIQWPIDDPLLSQRDQSSPFLAQTPLRSSMHLRKLHG